MYDKDLALLTKLAWMHYIQGMTHMRIADATGLSRTKVTRMLLEAKRRGIVEINISGEYKSCVELEYAIREKLPLKKVIVAPSGDDEETTLKSVGRATADYLNDNLQKNDVLGLAWGMSFYYILPYLKQQCGLDLYTVQLMGGVSNGGKKDPQNLITQMSSRLMARGIHKNVPAIVESGEIKEILLRDSGIGQMMDMAENCTKALLGIGSIIPDRSVLGKVGIVGSKDLERLANEYNAVGDIVGWFIDESGEVVKSEFSDRIMSPMPEIIKKIPEKIVEVYGVKKLKPTLAAIKGGWIDVLIMDERLAEAIIANC